MARSKLPIVKLTTAATPIDRKGGKDGYRIVKSGKTILLIPDQMELADAKAANRTSPGQLETFYNAGLDGGSGRKGDQPFNTNIFYINMSVLHPILEALVESDLVTEDKLYDIISPLLIDKQAYDKTTRRKYRVIDGAIGTAIHNLNAFVIANMDDSRMRDILDDYGIDRILYFVDVPRTEFFTPVKQAPDMWLQDCSDYYTKLDTNEWALHDSEDNLTPPGFDLQCLGPDGKETYWDDLENLRESLGTASTKRLKSLTIRGMALLKDAQLKGDIVIINRGDGLVDLNQAQPLADLKSDNVLGLNNVSIVFNPDGSIYRLDKYIKNLDKLAIYANIVEKNINIGSENVDPLHYSAREEEGEEDTYSISKDGIQLGRLVFVKRDPPDPDPGTWEFRPASIPGAITVNIDPKKLPPIAKQLRYVKNAATEKPLKVVPGDIPSETRGSEHSFAFMIKANEGTASALGELADIQNKLQQVVPHHAGEPNKLYVSGADTLHIALGGKYSDILGTLTTELIEKAVANMKDAVAKQGAAPIVITLNGLKITDNGAIVLDIVNNPDLARLRALVRDAMIKAGWDKDIVKVLTVNNEPSPSGVLTIARIVPTEKGGKVPMLMSEAELESLKKEVSRINEGLKEKPITINLNTISFSSPTGEFHSGVLENEQKIPLTGPGVGAIRMKYGGLTTAEHGTRRYGHLDLKLTPKRLKALIKALMTEKTINGAVGRLIKSGNSAYAISKNGIHLEGDIDIEPLLIPTGDKTLASLQKSLDSLGINFIVIKGLKKELGVPKDLVFHYGVTRKSVYIDEEDFNYLLSLENGVELILQGARHEVAHIDNPDLSEVEIEKLAPSYDVRIALTLRDVNSKRDKMNIVQQRFIEGQEYEGIGKYYKPLEKFAKFGTSGVRWLVKGAADVLAKLPERVSYYISNDYKRTVDGEEVLAEDFNMPNVSIVIKSIALYNLQKAQGIHPVISGSTEEFKKRLFGKGLLVMYDNRPGNFENAQQTARILAAYGIKVVLTKSDNNYNVPTPLPAVSRLVTIGGYAGSITFTASHNGDEWNGIKFEGEDGGAASPKITDAIGAILTEELALKNPEKPVEYDMTEEDVETLIKQGKVATIDTLEFYVEEVAKYLDIEAIKKAIKDRRVKLVYSAFFGSSGPAMVKLFQKMGLPTDNITDNIIETEKSADQGYVASYEPTLEKLEKLMATVRARGEEIKEKNLKTVVIGGSADNDADRFQVNQYNRTTGEVEEFTPEKLAAVLGHYLYKYRRFKGPMGRSFVTGSLQDEVAKLFGEDTVETAVGFKFSPKVFVEKGGILFTEESYGLSFQRWTLDKDGILPSLLALELVAVTGKSLDEYYRDVLNELEKAGLASNKYFKRYDQALDEKVKQKAIERFTEFFNGTNNISFGGQKIIKWYNPKEYDNGMKFVLADGSWVAFRSSGTEPIIKIYIEARSEAERDMLREEAFKLIGISDLDLSGVSGLPIILRQKTGEIILEGTLISEHRWSRPLKDAGNSIANPSAINESNGSREVYYGYRNVVSRPHAAKVDEQKLRFDITVLMPGLIDEKNDREFIMTKGHMHVVAVEGPIQPSSHPEFYEVWNGQAIYIQQGVNPQSGKFEVIATYAKAGDKVLLLPGYSHRTINIGNVPLVMANWISHEVGGKRKRVEGDERYVAVPKEEEVIPGNAKANFAEIEKNNGYAYWVMRTPDGRIEFVYNPNYGVIPPQIRFTTAVKEIPRFNLSNQEPMYSQFRNATLAKFLNNSSGFEDVYNEAFNLVEETPAVTVPAIFDHTVESIMQSSDTGERVRKAAETKFKEEGKDIGKKHLIFVKSAIPEKQLATTTAINLANFCEDYYNEMDGYSAHIVDSYEKAVELLAKNPDWDKNNTIVGLINAQDLDKMSAALEKNAMKGKAKLLAMEKFNEDQFVPIKGFFDLMSVLVRINRPLDRDKDRELLDGIRDLLSEIGVRDINRLVDALSAGGYFEDPIKFAKNFILRLLPPTKPRDAKELKQLYDAVKKVIESL